jgi:ELWxxDGT repeat protein
MRSWKYVVMICSLLAGCGGDPLLDESQPKDEALAEAPSEPGEVSAMCCRLEPGRARLVKDILPPSDLPARIGPAPEDLVAFRGQLYFAVNFDDGRRGVWKSDGTSAGTVAVREFPASVGPTLFTSLEELTAAGSQLFFFVRDEAHGYELWKSDGTPAGTALLKDVTPGPEDSFLSGLTVARESIYFFRYFPDTPTTPARTELWKSNGTTAGTVRVKDLGLGSFVLQMRATLGNTLLFVVETPDHGTELWRSDGTEAGTFLVKDIHPGPAGAYPSNLRAVAGRVFFTASDAEHGLGVWRTDGTSAGTVRVEALGAGTSHEGLRLLTAVGPHLYLTTSDSTDQRMRVYRLNVWVPSPGAAEPVATLPNPFASEPDAAPYLTSFTAAGGKLFFGMGISTSGPAPRDVQLWVTDGTSAGTRLVVRPLSLSDEFESQLYPLENRVLFSAFEAESAGIEPWLTDGSPGGSRRLQDIAPGGESSYPRGFTRVGMSLFFVASDEVHDSELWVMPLRYVH